MVALQLLLCEHFVALLQGINDYGNNSSQVKHVLPLETHHTILANQNSIADFCQEKV